MAQIHVTVSDSEKAAAEKYAAMDARTLSNLCRKALLEKMRRDRKKDENGEIILPPAEDR